MRLQSRVMVEVEPLSDVRWARVERDLFAKLDESPVAEIAVATEAGGRRRSLVWVAAIAAVAAALFAIVHPGRSVHWDDRLRLATTDSTSQFTVGESSLTVAPHSLVLVSGDDDYGIDVVLDRGTVTCEVAPRRGRPPFRLDAGEVRVRVVGTKFTVTREGGETSVDVEEGAVEVTARGVVAVLHGGEHWPVRTVLVPTVIRATAADTRAPGVNPPPLALAPPQASEPAATPSPARSPARSSRRRHAPTSSAGGAPETTGAAMTSAGTTTTSSTEAPMIEPASDLTPSSAPNSAPDPAAAPATPEAPSAQPVYEGASKIEKSKPDQAMAAYRQVAASHSAWAQLAFFAMGRLESDRGNRAEATKLLNAYLTRYPHGLNVDDARELLRRMR